MANQAISKARSEMRDRLAQSPEDAMARITEDIRTADTAGSVLAPQALTQARSLVGRPLITESFEYAQSTIAGQESFLVIHSVDAETGEVITWSCGSAIVTAQLERLAELEALPFRATLTERETQRGTTVLRLVDDSQVIQGEAEEH